MITNRQKWEAWERDFQKSQPVDFQKNLKLVEEMLAEAQLLGALPPNNPLEGIEVKIRLARIINVHKSD